MARHRLFAAELATLAAAGGGELVIAGDEAHHAVKVKRLEVGDAVGVIDTLGCVGEGVVQAITKPRGVFAISVRVERVAVAPRLVPRIEVWAAAPKGDRLEQMIDQLSQVGAAAYAPLHTARSVVDPREGKLQRLHRVALESAKQSGRAWALEILEGGDLDAACAGGVNAQAQIVLADASGGAYVRTGAAAVRLLIGPEGGWTPEEISRARTGGIPIANFGPCVQRIETAAVSAAAVILNRETQS
ncbi:MAG: RsmE family RNA methyltransferase [Planctomycetota bacterium]|nr:RsmE family RNA methyltransferase [Planctomycetota bacterium]